MLRLIRWTTVVLLVQSAMAQTTLPAAKGPPALEFPHFPDRLHAFVWRNWECVDAARMADVVGTTPENIRAIGRSMGLPDNPTIGPEMLQRNYICIIRRNWHLLPYDQLLKLLDWDEERLVYTLREDDFLWTKLGGLKPQCDPIRYTSPSEAVEKRCAGIKAIVEKYFGDELSKPTEPRFAFLNDLSAAVPSSNPQSAIRNSQSHPRFLYSYFAVYGDPLLNPQLDPFPDGLLQRLAEAGVNGVWLHTVLRQLAPSPIFPEFGKDHEVRLTNLQKLVTRARRFGINVYLYMNEPRAMQADFFENHPEVRGIAENDHFTMCTSQPQVRQWLTDSLAYVFKNVPDLGGVFTITASENLTNCASHFHKELCPRCSKRTHAEIIAEVNTAIAAGVRAGRPEAKVIAWDWGWPDQEAEATINALPADVYLMSVSEWSKPITRGGVSSTVDEYSISAVGPGPRATRHWAIAKKRGLKTLAKVQVNCTWELSAVPWLPVMNLVAEHMKNLTTADIDGLMLSWTLGGYPSPNLRIVQKLIDRPGEMTVEKALKETAVERYGPAAAPDVLKAWAAFSKAFSEFPYSPVFLYDGPMQVGPANLLYAKPSGYAATMVGIPYDDLERWRGVYPAEVLATQLEKVAAGWQTGLKHLHEVVELSDIPATERDKNVRAASASEWSAIAGDLRLAEAAFLHFKSAANQVRFIIARNSKLPATTQPTAQRGNPLHADETLRTILGDEVQLARRLFTLTRRDSRVGFEASNHYYYLPLDLVEKVVNCEMILKAIDENQ